MKKYNFLFNFFLFTIFTAPLYLLRVKFFGVGTNVFEIIALLAIIYFLLTWAKNSDDFKIKKIDTLFCLSIALILTGVIISLLFNTNKIAGLGVLKSWFLLPLVFSYLLFLLADSQKKINRILQAVYFSSAAVSIIAIGYKLAHLVTYDNRLTAFYASANYLAMYLAPGFLLGLYFLFDCFEKNSNRKIKIFYSFSFLSICFALFFTFSYGTWVSLFGSLFIVFLILRPKNILKIALGFLLIFVFLIFSQIHNPKFTSLLTFSNRSSLASRTMIWNASVLMLKQHPFAGIGPANFQAYYLALQPQFAPYLEWAVPEPHNLYLAFWIQAGFIGLVGFLMLLIYLFEKLITLSKQKNNLAIVLLAFFLYTSLHGIMDTPYWKNDLAFLFWVFAFLSLKLNSINQTLDENGHPMKDPGKC